MSANTCDTCAKRDGCILRILAGVVGEVVYCGKCNKAHRTDVVLKGKKADSFIIEEVGRMTDELKPCPFCGKEAWLGNLMKKERGSAIYGVGCSDPECIGYETICVKFDTKEDALAAWNRRPGCDGCRWVYSEDRWKECRYCSRRWLYTDRYEPKDDDEKEE